MHFAKCTLAVCAALGTFLPAPSEAASTSNKPAGAAERGAANAVTEPGAAQTVPAAPKVMTRDEILAADPASLERIGRHLVIGYHSYSQVKALVAKKAIAGIFITDHNVRGRKASAVKADIDALQEIREVQGLHPLVVAADQEGGSVSRLSPPLKRQPALATAIAKAENDKQRREIVEEYARLQASELTRAGVNMNFGPVVDLRLNPKNYSDGETRLRLRAIAADPFLVSKVAGWYCDILAEAKIMCTLKHFPGLGRITRDTHVATAELTATEGTLELNDWVPFRRVMSKPTAVTMLGHVRVAVIDKTHPASFSDQVIGSLIRKTWAHDGLLVTDDFSMGAVTKSKGGPGAAAVKSINAGMDLVLVSYSEKDLDSVMTALLRADAEGKLDTKVLEASRERVRQTLARLKGSDPEPGTNP